MALLYSEKLPLGWEAPSFRLPDTEGKHYALNDFVDKSGLLLVFTCNHCPYAQAAWPLVINLYHQYHQKIAFVAINPNDEVAYPEDSLAVMKQKKSDWQIPFPYLRDGSQTVAQAYRAQCTPDLYLFQRDSDQFKLFYHGRVNDNWQRPDQVKENNLADAIKRLLDGQGPPTNQPPSMGCSIKWRG